MHWPTQNNILRSSHVLAGLTLPKQKLILSHTSYFWMKFMVETLDAMIGFDAWTKQNVDVKALIWMSDHYITNIVLLY